MSDVVLEAVPLTAALFAPFGEVTLQQTLGAYRSVIERRAPIRLTGSGSLYGQDPKYFDALLAPLSDNGVTVNMILGTFVFFWDLEHQFRPPVDPRLAKYV